jgi:hypothetical protein
MRALCAIVVVLAAATFACRPSDVLSVPPPANVVGSGAVKNAAGVESEFIGARGQMFAALAGANNLMQWSGVLSDEFSWGAVFAPGANVDARMTTAQGGFSEVGDAALASILQTRSTLLQVVGGLRQYDPSAGAARIGEAYALIAYGELFMAEDYCAGVPLSYIIADGGIVYGMPLTTDSLLAVAEAHFDSAITHASGSDTVLSLAGIGLGRARLDRNEYAIAASAVSGVATGFVYNTELEATTDQGAPYVVNLYANNYLYYGPSQPCGLTNVADHEGGNGLGFVSAHDPRVVVDSTIALTCGATYTGVTPGTWYYPMKFGAFPSTLVPLATGVEARLIEAEVALHTNDVGGWAADLSALRADSASTHVAFDTSQSPIHADSTIGLSADGQVDMMFRERAFWLFGTGTRLGDLRRLIRQYGRDQATLFPVGPFPDGHDSNLPTPILNYGNDVSLTLPTRASGTPITNPNYKGCTTPTTTA